MNWAAIADFIGGLLKSIFGTDKPQKTTVVNPDPEAEISDGKTHKQKMEDLGL